MKKYFLFIVLSTAGYTQIVYEANPGSKNNLFELSISNNTKNDIRSVIVNVQEAPDWAEFISNELNLNNIKVSEKQTVQFYFNIKDNAPIGEEAPIKFKIEDNINGSSFKIYNIKITPPKVFEVYQNYPNPFNPSTTIKYSIPQDAFVTIRVFNVLGEEVSVLINKVMKAGIQEEVFDATNLGSGFYLYILEAKGIDGRKYFSTKKMIVLK